MRLKVLSIVHVGPPKNTKELEREVKALVKMRLSKDECPREIEFVCELSRTPDDNIMRKVLRERI